MARRIGVTVPHCHCKHGGFGEVAGECGGEIHKPPGMLQK